MIEDKTKFLINLILKTADDKKAENICYYDFYGKEWISDYIIIIGVKNHIHCKAVHDSIEETSKKFIKKSENIEYFDFPTINGKAESSWVIIDYKSIMCHCISNELREKYELDDLFRKKSSAIYYKGL